MRFRLCIKVMTSLLNIKISILLKSSPEVRRMSSLLSSLNAKKIAPHVSNKSSLLTSQHPQNYYQVAIEQHLHPDFLDEAVVLLCDISHVIKLCPAPHN